MANEFRHKDAGTSLTQAEDNAVDRHYANNQQANDMLYFNGTYWIRATAATIAALLDHGTLSGLDDADHDAVYFQESEFLNTSAGAGDAGKPIKLDAGGKVDATMVNDADIDHGSIGGLTDDDHTQYTKKATLTTKGDVYVATAASTPARLAVGANDTVLAADSAQSAGAKWATLASIGAAVLTIATTEVFASATPPNGFTDLDLSGTVGSNLALVLLRVTTTGGNDSPIYSFRTNGETVTLLGNLNVTEAIDDGEEAYVILRTSSAGVIEWDGGTGGGRTASVDIVAYMK